MHLPQLLAFAGLAAAAAARTQSGWDDPFPAPCGRSIPSGRCMSEPTCLEAGGFYVQRDCTFYDVLDIVCCYKPC